jgi:cobalt-precorrin 5A hydrolase
MRNQKIAIVTINQPSLDSAIKLNHFLKDYKVDIFTSKKTPKKPQNIKTFDKLDDILKPAWQTYDIIICILAIGAVVRKIAPLLISKEKDPAIIVIDITLTKIVPLLSGHLGGANDFTQTLTKILPNSIDFISTATDQTNTIAFDILAKQNNWQIENIQALANISNRLLNKQKVKVYTFKSIFATLTNQELLEFTTKLDDDQNSVLITPFDIKSQNLILKPYIYLGIGCNKNTPLQDIEEAIKLFLDQNNLSFKQIKNIASFEAKKDEVGLLDFANKYDFDIKFYDKTNINSLEYDFSHSASTKFFELKGVAEPSAILLSCYKELIVKKHSYFKSITIAASI